jgi:hypothetical protein
MASAWTTINFATGLRKVSSVIVSTASFFVDAFVGSDKNEEV